MSLLDDVKDLPVQKWGQWLLPSTATLVHGSSYRARQFIFDQASSRTMGAFVGTCADLVADQLQFAIPPYDVAYIEIDLHGFNIGLGTPASLLSTVQGSRKGYLASGHRIFVLEYDSDDRNAVVNVFGVGDLDRAPPVLRPLTDTEVQGFQVALLGSSYHNLTDHQRRAFSSRFGIPYYGHPEFYQEAVEHYYEGGFGYGVHYAAALLLLLQQRHITITDRPAERKMVRGKSRAFMAYSTVTINLHGAAEIRRAFTVTDRDGPRRHEVRTHYAHRHGRKDCEHWWVPVVDPEKKHWNCTRCGRLRWLVKDYLRGNGSKGFVTKSYHVTDRGDDSGDRPHK